MEEWRLTIADHEALETILALQQAVHAVGVLASIAAVVASVCAHDRGCTRLDCGLEGPTVSALAHAAIVLATGAHPYSSCSVFGSMFDERDWFAAPGMRAGGIRLVSCSLPMKCLTQDITFFSNP